MVLLFVSFFILLLLGVPVVVSIAVSSFIVMASVLPFDQAVLVAVQKTFSGVDRFGLIAIPLFVLAGNILNQGGIAKRLIRLSNLIGHKLPHSILHTNVIANMLFGAISGSATAAAVGVGGLIGPSTKEKGYSNEFATCVNIVSAPAGLLIPPSNTLILYSVVSGQASVIALFLGGYLPGILMGLGTMVVIAILAKKNIIHPVVQNEETQIEAKGKIIWDSIPSLLLIVIIIVGILSGVFTATEASGIAVLYALFLSFIYRHIKLKDYLVILKDSAIVSSIILLIIAASNMMGWVMAYTQTPEAVANFILSLSDNQYLILFLINITLLIVGTFLDMSPAVLIFTPIFLPIANQIGLHPVHFGIIMTYNLCIGILTPPVGTLLFVGSSISGVKVKDIMRKILPFYVILIITLFAVTYLPFLTLWIPTLAGVL